MSQSSRHALFCPTRLDARATCACTLGRKRERNRAPVEPHPVSLGRVVIAGAKVALAERERTREMANLVVRLCGEIRGIVSSDPYVSASINQVKLAPWIVGAETRATTLLGKAPPRGGALPMYWSNASDVGGCNFCHARERVLIVESKGGLQVRICPDCHDEIARAGTPPSLRVRMPQ